MRTPPRLDEIDLGPQKRVIYLHVFSVWYIIAAAVMGLGSCGAGVSFFDFRNRSMPATGDAKTMMILLSILGVILLLVALLMAGLKVYSSNERILVFADGVCWEHWSKQECYRWKDIEKIVWYSADPGVYWLYFNTGRKVAVSLMGGIKEKDWQSLRNLLEKKVPGKFVDES